MDKKKLARNIIIAAVVAAIVGGVILHGCAQDLAIDEGSYDSGTDAARN